MSNKIQASVTVAINSIAQGKKAAGIRVYNLSAGEPKLMTPEIVRNAAIQFIEKGDIPYPTPAGQPELRKAAVDYMNNLFSSNYTIKECIATTGGKFGLYLMMQYLLGLNSPLKMSSHDKLGVMIPVPYWVSYPAIVEIMNGTSVLVNTTEDTKWKITPEMIKKAYTPLTKILILNNGVNPTGVIYNRAEITAIMKVAHELNLVVLSDEVYSGLVYTSDEYVSCASFPEYKDNVIILQSASKTFAMTGWRVGFMFARADWIEALVALTSQSTTGVSLVCQHGAIAAFNHADEITSWVNATMKKRRDIFLTAFKEHFGMELDVPKATLYAWTSLKSLGIHDLNDEEFCIRALEEANVATVPGSAFGQAGYIRFSFAAEEDDLIGGVANLAQFTKKLNIH